MADNVTANPGASGPVFKTDEDGGVHVPVNKIQLGDNSAFDGYVSKNNPMPTAAGVQSAGNTTTTPLTASQTFTGTGEQNNHPDVMVSCFCDSNATLFFDFSVDGANWRTFPPSGFQVTANIHEFHTAVKGPRHFRARLTDSGSGNTVTQLYTYYGHFRQGNAPINFTISDDADAMVVKSVISGIGNTTAEVTRHKALQVTPPAEGKSAFGEALSSNIEPSVQIVFVYDINNLLCKVEDNGGTASIDTSMLTLSTGAAANQSSTMQSVKATKYEPGIGFRSRFTGLFTTGVANSQQIIGVGNACEGLFFGYNGTSFGVMRRFGGAQEIRTLTITTASATAEDITITLDGDATATVTVTASSNKTTTANEIAAHDYSSVGRGWDAVAEGDKVIFTSWDAAAHSGTYSLSAATSAVGSFAQTLAGAEPTDSWVPQASWNGLDIFDGNGITGVTLDTTKGNVFQIDFQYLGFGLIRFYIEDPNNGEFHLVHSIEFANANTRPSFDNPTFKLYASAENFANASDIVLKSGSMANFIDGKRLSGGIIRGVEASRTNTTANEEPVLSIKLSEIYKSKQNRSKLKVNFFSGAVEHTKPVTIRFYLNATLTDAAFTDIDAANSSVKKDTTASSAAGGLFLFALPLGKSSNELIDMKDKLDLALFDVGDVLTVTADAFSATNAEITIGVNFTEIQ